MSDRIELDVSPSRLTDLDQFIAKFVDRSGLGQDERSWLAILLDELITNVAKYAYPDDAAAKPVAITLARREDHMIVELKDEGRPFDPSDYRVRHLGAPLDDRPEGGLGIHIVRQMADEMRYRRANGRNILRIVKYVQQ